MQPDFPFDDSVPPQPDSQNRSLIITSWVLIALVCLLALVPFLGFGSWLIASPILFITLIMGIIVLSRGGTLPGLVILLTSLIVAPVFILIAPFVSSLVGIGGASMVVGTSVAAAQKMENSPALPPLYETPNTQKPLPNDRPFELPGGDFLQVRDQIQNLTVKIAALKSTQLIAEGPKGFLTGSDRLDLAQRQFVQQENYFREKMFALIAKSQSCTPEEVADAFASLAQKANQTTPPPAQ